MKILWLLFLCVCILPRFAIGGNGCNSQCSLEEMNVFWGDCCCVQCSNGIYLDLPDGMSSDDQLPWWTCCDFARPYYEYFLHSVVLLLFYCNFWFWYNGHALVPTSIVELSRPTNNEGNEQLDRGARTILSGRVVRHITLHSNTTKEEQKTESSSTNFSHSAIIEVFGQKDATDTKPIVIPLKSYATRNELEDYCQAREGKWWKTTTTDVPNPTNGYHLIIMGVDSDELLMYRPYSYDTRWKTEIFFFSMDIVGITIAFLFEVPTRYGVLLYSLTT